MIRIGLLGASRIAREAIIAPARDVKGTKVTRVAARSTVRAEVYAGEHGIQGVEPDYAALVTCPDVDLVYNGLPPSEHREWTIAALEAGKHVLCEKPFAMDAAEAKEMVAAADRTGRVLIEAFHYRFHPLFLRVLEIVNAGTIGEVKQVDARFNVPIAYSPGEIRYNKALGGGALMDLGCYSVHWARTVIAEEPVVIGATADRHETGVDVTTEAELEFPGGVKSRVSASMFEGLPDGLDAELRIYGNGGMLTVVNPLSPHSGHVLILTSDAGTETTEVAGETTYHHQLAHVVDVIERGITPLTGGADAIANMRALDTIRRLSE